VGRASPRANIVNSAHARDDRHDVEVGFDIDRRILALRDHFVKESGAYTPVAVGAPSITIAHPMGPHSEF
jgi:carbon-monoxide dehydrogenase large subunit